ncbi:hypothetical protein OUZ56_009904 [Daphnia magna]|uniref:Uncharacterized protein n=1 Tax=Daphnia magna TaxID=35525 RepID=A0ABR0AH92_9CRUS|nr:hypothetical protein OUZ56_009904 [Daphnia magna]
MQQNATKTATVEILTSDLGYPTSDFLEIEYELWWIGYGKLYDKIEAEKRLRLIRFTKSEAIKAIRNKGTIRPVGNFRNFRQLKKKKTKTNNNEKKKKKRRTCEGIRNGTVPAVGRPPARELVDSYCHTIKFPLSRLISSSGCNTKGSDVSPPTN